MKISACQSPNAPYLSAPSAKKKTYKVPARIVEKYMVGMEPDEVDRIIELALEAWFRKEKADV